MSFKLIALVELLRGRSILMLLPKSRITHISSIYQMWRESFTSDFSLETDTRWNRFLCGYFPEHLKCWPLQVKCQSILFILKIFTYNHLLFHSYHTNELPALAYIGLRDELVNHNVTLDTLDHRDNVAPIFQPERTTFKMPVDTWVRTRD